MPLEELLNLLRNHDDQARRAEVADQLGKLGDGRAVPALLEALGDPHMDLRDNAAFALAELGAVTAVPGIVKLLRDPAKQVRKTAAKGLGMLRARDAVPALIETLEDPSYLVRKNVIRSLGQIGGPSALQALRNVPTTEKEGVLVEMARKAAAQLAKERNH